MFHLGLTFAALASAGIQTLYSVRSSTCGTPAASARRAWSIKECLLVWTDYSTRRVQIQIPIRFRRILTIALNSSMTKIKRSFDDVFCASLQVFWILNRGGHLGVGFYKRCLPLSKEMSTPLSTFNHLRLPQRQQWMGRKNLPRVRHHSSLGKIKNTLQLLVSTVSTVTQWQASSHFVVWWLFLSSLYRKNADFLTENKPCNCCKICCIKCVTGSFQYVIFNLFNIFTETCVRVTTL